MLHAAAASTSSALLDCSWRLMGASFPRAYARTCRRCRCPAPQSLYRSAYTCSSGVGLFGSEVFCCDV